MEELTTELHSKLKAAGYKYLAKFDEKTDEMSGSEWHFKPLKDNKAYRHSAILLDDIKFTSYISGVNEMGYYMVEVPQDL